MNSKKYFLISGVVFGIVAILHLVRVLLGCEVLIGEWIVPYWMSWVAIIVAGALSIWAFRQTGKK